MPPGDPAALAGALSGCSPIPPSASAWASARRSGGRGPYSWDRIAERTLAVYEEVLA